MFHVDHQTLKTCTTLPLRHPIQRPQQFLVVSWIIAVGSGITGRVDARCPLEIVHLQTGIIGNSRQSGMGCRIARLENSVLDEGKAGLLCLYYTELCLRYHLHLKVGKQLTQLFHLSLVAGCQYDFFHARDSC